MSGNVIDLASKTAERERAGAPRFMNGMEALIHGILKHRQTEGDAPTAAYVSGYRGSPLGGFDSLLWRQRDTLSAHRITFKPGLNEDLAATSCWGTQQLALMENPKYEGVVAFWYGKGPGVDRSGDVLKHANMAGTLPKGGVVMLVGDDHGAKSSTVAHQSDQILAAAGIPILYPATIEDYVDSVGIAVALSRFASVWVAIKCVTETVESSAVVDTSRPALELTLPEVARPAGGYHIGAGHIPVAQEHSLFSYRLPAVKAFAARNALDRVAWDAEVRAFGIVAPGKSFVDVVEGLRLLGIGEAEAQQIGLRLFRPLMIWPLVAKPIEDFCRGHREILVVEEKRPVIEEQLGGILLRMEGRERPALSGKLDPEGMPLVSDHGELSPISVARAIGARLVALGIATQAVEAAWRGLEARAVPAHPAAPARTPAFCSGCPHNRSTVLPDGSMAFGGIGCHGMALFVPELRTPSATHMGGEGANWIGLEDFVGTGHIFQNMGEGTYAHSGLLAIRAAVAAGSNVTYKILHNAATAMTGGQPVEGGFTATDIARQLLAEGVKTVAIVTEAPDANRDLPSGVKVYPRTALDPVQRALRDVSGVTALIYEQGCAAERRRLRKAGQYPDPAMRTYINPDVCEGCGDCGAKSSCVSIVPLETELGRKRMIDQESCNKDYSCVEGFCPSFVTVQGGVLRTAEIGADLAERAGAALWGADPVFADEPCNIVLSGIGGTGIVTLGGLLARAAMRAGWRTSSFDVTGLAQKNGPVYSHVRLARTNDPSVYQPRVPAGQLDILVGCDAAATAFPAITQLLSGERSRAFVNAALVPTASFQRNPDQMIGTQPYAEALAGLLPPDRLSFVDFGAAGRRLIGQGALMNIAMLGFAVQQGAIPISTECFEAEMVRKGRTDHGSLFAFRFGRLLAVDPVRAAALLDAGASKAPQPLEALPLEAVIERCRSILADYQNVRYADRYEALVRRVAAVDSGGRVAHAVARNLFRLMRYKDEYEVARLYADPSFMEGLKAQFGGDPKLLFHLAPPILNFRKTARGEPIKRRFGGWMMPAFRLLSKFKFLRGTVFDPFGPLADRRMERALIRDYIDWIEELLARWQQIDAEIALRVAELPHQVRGYGPVKERSVRRMRAERAELAGQL